MKKCLMAAVLVAFVCAFALPAMAAEEVSWKFYGSARMGTFYEKDDALATPGLLFDDSDLAWGLQSNSRIGARVKAGDIGGRFEYGHTGTVNLRLLYGTWNFGAGTILVGQDYTPLNIFYSNQVAQGDTDLLPFGGIYRGRRPQLKLKIAGFDLALVEPTTSAIPGTPFAAEFDTTIPKIEASYGFNVGVLNLKLLGGYASYDVVNSATDQEYGIDSYFYGVALKAGFGPFTLAGNVWGGQNLGPFGFSVNSTTAAGGQSGFGPGITEFPAWDGVNDFNDNDSFGWYLVATFKATDVLTFEGGYGSVKHELDAPGTWEDDSASWYVNCTINIAKGFFVVPEIGQFDYKDVQWGTPTSTDQGDTTYFGAKWQINF